MKKYYSPNHSQMRAAVRGKEPYRYYARRRLTWVRIGAVLVFLALWTMIFLFGFTDWSW